MTAPIAHAEFVSPCSSPSEIIQAASAPPEFVCSGTSISFIASRQSLRRYFQPRQHSEPCIQKNRASSSAKKVPPSVWCSPLHAERERYNFALWWLGDRFWSVYPVCAFTAPDVTDSYKSECHQQANNGPDGRIVFWFLTDHYYIIEYVCALCVSILLCMQRRLPWLLLGAACASPLIFRSFQFLAMFCFGCCGAFSSFSCVFTIHQRTRGNAPQCGFILELQTHSQWFYLSVCCVLMDLWIYCRCWLGKACHDGFWRICLPSEMLNGTIKIFVCVCLRCGQLRLYSEGSRLYSLYNTITIIGFVVFWVAQGTRTFIFHIAPSEITSLLLW